MATEYFTLSTFMDNGVIDNFALLKYFHSKNSEEQNK